MGTFFPSGEGKLGLIRPMGTFSPSGEGKLGLIPALGALSRSKGRRKYSLPSA